MQSTQELQDIKGLWADSKKFRVELCPFLRKNWDKQGDTQWEKSSWHLLLPEDPIFLDN